MFGRSRSAFGLIIAVVVVVGCDSLESPQSVDVTRGKAGKNAGSGESVDATIRLAQIKDEYLDRVNFGQVSAVSDKPQCAPAQKQFSLGRAEIPFNGKLAHGCDYKVTVELGNQDLSSMNGAFLAYYRSQISYVASDEVDAATAAKPLQISFSSFAQTQAAVQKSLPAYDSIVFASPTPAPTGTNGVPSTPENNAGGATQTPQTKAAVFSQIQVTTSAGANVTLDSVIKGKYMLLDLSSPTCSPCRELASEMNQNQALKQVVDAGKCSVATMIAGEEYSQWLNAFPATTQTGSHSYGVNENFNTIPQHFGAKFNGYVPYVLVIDIATGQVASKTEDINQFVNMCQ